MAQVPAVAPESGVVAQLEVVAVTKDEGVVLAAVAPQPCMGDDVPLLPTTMDEALPEAEALVLRLAGRDVLEGTELPVPSDPFSEDEAGEFDESPKLNTSAEDGAALPLFKFSRNPLLGDSCLASEAELSGLPARLTASSATLFTSAPGSSEMLTQGLS